jgi:dCTP deaminase
MTLSDKDIRQALENGDITISDYDPKRLQPASYDVLLGYEFMIFDKHNLDCIDPKKPIAGAMRKIKLENEDECFVIHPGEFVLGVTLDRIGLGAGFSAQISGKSSVARLGLIIHTIAGFIDPGNVCNITLEFVNLNSLPIKLYPRMKIGQIVFFKLSSEAEKPYGHNELNSKYYGSTTVEESRFWLNYPHHERSHTSEAKPEIVENGKNDLQINSKTKEKTLTQNQKPKEGQNNNSTLNDNDLSEEITEKEILSEIQQNESLF